MILTDRQVEQILGRSKIDEEEQRWDIKAFLFKENTVIFPEATTNSLGDLVKREKSNMNMFVSENIRKNYTERPNPTAKKPPQKSSKESFAAMSEGGLSNRNRNKSLSDIKSVRERYSFNNNGNQTGNPAGSKIANYLADK